MTEPTIQNKILSSLLYKPDFFEKVSSYLKLDYFDSEHERIVLDLIKGFYEKYDKAPTKEALLIGLDNKKYNNQDTINDSKRLINNLFPPEEDNSWLIDNTEGFFKQKALYLAIVKAYETFNGYYNGDAGLNIDSLPNILEDALSVSFEDKLGHCYMSDAEYRFDLYNEHVDKYPFDIELFNKITDGGLRRKTLNIFAAGTGGCKSLLLCHNAANYLMQGKNVLYFTLEMAEVAIAERIDANLLGININSIKHMNKSHFLKKIEDVMSRTPGKLTIKEYPTGCANANTFKYYIKELKSKEGFVPDIIIIDYLGICSSVKSNIEASYLKHTAVAEELRALASELNLPILSAVQLNRTGSASGEPSITDIANSHGIAQTVDLAIGIVSNEDLDMNDELMVIQLKNRYNATNPRKFKIGVKKSHMRVYNIEDAHVKGQLKQDNLVIESPVFNFDLNSEPNLSKTEFNFN